MSIVSSAKHFLATPLAQKVINLIRSGRVVYTTASNNSLISDNYTSTRRARAGSSGFIGRTLHDLTSDLPPGVQGKGQPPGVFLYDPRLNGWLDYTRLRIPVWRTWIEFWNFAVLLVLFTWNLADRNLDRPKIHEILFIIFTLGFSLDEFAASKEHGWTIYFASAWNAFDLSFIFVFFVYLGMRIYGAITHSSETAELSFDVLSMGACILFPRIAFFFIRDNVIIISVSWCLVIRGLCRDADLTTTAPAQSHDRRLCRVHEFGRRLFLRAVVHFMDARAWYLDSEADWLVNAVSPAWSAC